MALIRLGDVVKQRREKYDGEEHLISRGVTRDGFIKPKQGEADTSIYNVFYRKDFVFNPARMELNSIAYNSFYDKAICSSLYEIFYVIREDIILPEFLNLIIKRDEFARKCAFNAIGSARNYFRFGDIIQFEIDVPPIEIQKKYVAIYEGFLENLKVYESKLEELKLVCDGYIEDLKKKYPIQEIGTYIEQYKEINSSLKVTKLSGLIGGNIEEARTSSGQDNLAKFQIVYPKSIVYPPPHFGEIGTIGIVEDNPVLMSPMYVTFKAKNDEIIDMKYLLLWFRRKEFMRYAFFASCDSIRDTFDFEKLCEYKIPIPPLKIQKSIVKVFNAYNKRKEFIIRLKNIIKDICPILIKGAILEENKEQ